MEPEGDLHACAFIICKKKTWDLRGLKPPTPILTLDDSATLFLPNCWRIVFNVLLKNPKMLTQFGKLLKMSTSY
jgi:hypothetical protein